ncbi:MAG: acyl-CoA synthetase [Acidimicrobiia bacterium]
MSAPAPISAARDHGERLALVTSEGTFTYSELVQSATRVAAALLGDRTDLTEERVAFLVPPGARYVALQWGIWAAGGVSVPLCTSHPRGELEHVITDSGASILIASDEFAERLAPLGKDLGLEVRRAEAVIEAPVPSSPQLPSVDGSGRALILYTSGSTGKPKGVVWTHRMFQAQLESLSEAWGWRPDDRTLLALPLHHVHGLVNVLGCALWNGAVCEVLASFDASAVWDRLGSGELTVFMAVPTIYQKLIAEWNGWSAEAREAGSQGASGMRLMVSGSAALPVETLEAWRAITGHTLLERYGMTEIGMALSNPLDGERVPGSVGYPLPGVEMRIVDETTTPVSSGDPGELEVKGPSVFSEYWERPDATRDGFRDGWFRTGDIAIEEDGRYRIFGRKSVDVIKTGGEKVSALEVEGLLRTHPAIIDCAVIGVPDATWGEEVVAVVVTADAELDIDAVRDFAREHLAPYKLPRRLVHVDELPKNAMGKTVKPELKQLLTDEQNTRS